MSETRKLAAILVSTSSDTAGSLAPTRIARSRVFEACAAISSTPPSPPITAASSSAPAMAASSSFAAWSTLCGARSRCRTALSNATLAPARAPIEFRVGIHLGDVVEEADGDLMGDGEYRRETGEQVASRARSVFPRTPIAKCATS